MCVGSRELSGGSALRAIGGATMTAFFLTAGSWADPPSDEHFRVDQFGYRNEGTKIALLRRAMVGHDAPDDYVPGNPVQVRRWGDDSVVFDGPPQPWGGGNTQAQSGDRVWWLDFSGFRQTGTFYLHDPSLGISSEPFLIRPDVYGPVARQAARMFHHQRCGTAKLAAHAGSAWADAPCHLSTRQDLDCRSVSDPAPATSRDLSGGWHDAGDFNKYVNYADDAVHMLLDAYEESPGFWKMELNLPESGDAVPDLLDEIRWELQWLLRMQNVDGSVLHKVSVNQFQSASPASADTAFRSYAPPTASATISACGAFSHAATVFRSLKDPGAQIFANQLESAAVAAWTWLDAHPGQIPSNYDNQGFLNAAAEDDAYEQSMNRLRAAAYLFRLTGDPAYRTFVDANYPSSHLFLWGYAMAWEETAQSGLLAYALAPGATTATANQIRNAYSSQLSGPALLGQFAASTDAYRAHLADGDYTWGSNRTKSIVGEMFAAMTRMRWDPSNAPAYRAAGAGYLHYLHGTNASGLSFLTHMDGWGAGRSVREMYHAWFGDGTVWDNADLSPYGPPPGYLVGGVNPAYSPDAAYSGPPLEPPENQPIQKSYRDWNTGWPENSWEISECHIPYQAAYIRLLSEYTRCRGDCPCDSDGDGDLDVLDAAGFAPCMTGPGPAAAPPGCPSLQLARADGESDNDVDMMDFLVFQASFTGSD